MELILLCWIVVSVGCAFLLSHTAYEHHQGEFRWFLCGLILGPVSLVFLRFLRRVPGEEEPTHPCDPAFDPSHAAPASGTLDESLRR